jgi:hypothetical protein
MKLSHIVSAVVTGGLLAYALITSLVWTTAAVAQPASHAVRRVLIDHETNVACYTVVDRWDTLQCTGFIPPAVTDKYLLKK